MGRAVGAVRAPVPRQKAPAAPHASEGNCKSPQDTAGSPIAPLLLHKSSWLLLGEKLPAQDAPSGEAPWARNLAR
eukprot:15309505-Alexandrium_andersonii.AAC.1